MKFNRISNKFESTVNSDTDHLPHCPQHFPN